MNDWMNNPMLQMGLGILANNKRGVPAGQAIGTGALQGMASLMELQNQKEQSEERKLRAQQIKIQIEEAKRRNAMNEQIEAARGKYIGMQGGQELEGPPSPGQTTPPISDPTGLWAKDPNMARLMSMVPPEDFARTIIGRQDASTANEMAMRQFGLSKAKLDELIKQNEWSRFFEAYTHEDQMDLKQLELAADAATKGDSQSTSFMKELKHARELGVVDDQRYRQLLMWQLIGKDKANLVARMAGGTPMMNRPYKTTGTDPAIEGALGAVDSVLGGLQQGYGFGSPAAQLPGQMTPDQIIQQSGAMTDEQLRQIIEALDK